MIFDLDGVITDTAKYHYEAWKLLADELGLPFDRAFNEQLKGIDRMASLEKILSQMPDGGASITMEKRVQWATEKNKNYQRLIEAVDETEILPGILDLFRELKQRGIAIGLASASRNAGTLVRQLKVDSYFDVIVDPASVAHGKPAPDIFLKAAETLGIVSKYCVGVEDAEAGIRAIKGAGMFAIGVGDKQTLAEADYLVSETALLSLSEIERHFRQ
ncbi:beta-phosphoglucomutase [Paenibacillus sp. D2_2]|uniref:beta-phosphoglucomutase n=1 Tax=Paenibacillus sp. D2_2 TaxID=3073092 RepID=UPI0028152002|nr:beta-phosphoglucomutase [Paenibacillus sp. D2_2]WMT43420.1 beta-phosphoglucomutase [Paenibacillus sp. D2_2]